MATRSKTAAAKKQTLVRVIKDVLEVPEDGPLAKSLEFNGIDSMSDLLAIPESDIASLGYDDVSSNRFIPLALQGRAQIKILKAWNFHLLAITGNKRVDWDDINIVTPDEFDAFRVSIYDPDQPARKQSLAPQATSSSASGYSGSVPSSKSMSSDFRRGIKRDKTHYTELKDEKYWDDWQRKTTATVHAHGCENVIDPNYVPNTPDEIALFRDQQNFLYDVFLSVIKTHMGKFHVRNYEHVRDAQAVWRDYSNYMKTSTRADLQIEDLMTSLTSLRLDTNKHHGPTQSFITKWLDQIRLYEDLTPSKAHFPDMMKKAMLQNALNGVGAFRDVKTSEQLEVAKGRGAIGYNEYVTLVQKVAANHDNEHRQRRSFPVRNQANIHDLTMIEEYPDEHQGDYDEDEYFGSFSVNAARRNPNTFRSRRPSLRKDVWMQLSQNDQATWDNLSDDAKRTIIFGCQSNNKDSKASDTQRTNDMTPSTPTPRVVHQATTSSPTTNDDTSGIDSPDSSSTPSSCYDMVDSPDILIQAAQQGQPIPPADIRRMLSSPTPAPKVTPNAPQKSTPTQITNHEIQYKVSSSASNSARGALIDRGANGGLAGSDVRVIAKTDRLVDICGIDNHQMNSLPIVTAGGITNSNQGPILVVFHQYAHVPQGRTIHSSLQLESFGNAVDDKSSQIANGTQTITTVDGYIIPLHFINGLPYMDMRPFNDEEWSSLPHVVLTSDAQDWDPSIADLRHDDPQEYADPDLVPLQHTILDDPAQPILVNSHQVLDPQYIDDVALLVGTHQMTPTPRDLEPYREYFLNVPIESVRRTFDATTQYARSGWITGDIRRTHRAPFPALNVRRRNEGVATDTVFANVPAVDNGSTAAQFFTGKSSKFCSTHSCKTDAEFVRTLMDEIRKRGAMDTLVSDRAEAEISNKVKDVLRHLFIDDRQTEPHFHHQNPAERRFQNVKRNTNRVLNMSGAPANAWLLCMQYVCFIMNRTALESLQWRTPFERLYGSTPDISMIYRFKFWDQVYYLRDPSLHGTQNFPSESNEAAGRFVGFSESVGHPMTYIVLTDESSRIIYRSRLRLASDNPNRRLDHDGSSPDDTSEDGSIDQRIHDGHDSSTDEDSTDSEPVVRSHDRPMCNLDPDELLGRSFLSHPDDSGLRSRLYILEQLESLEAAANSHPEHVRFRCANNDDTVEEILTYNQLIDRLESPDGTDDEWRFHSITDHHGPLASSDPEYKGSRWNVRVNWEDGSATMEPLHLIAKSDPVTCAIYGRDNNLLHLDGWKRFARLARRQQKLLRMANQAKLQSFRHAPIYMFGVQVPRHHRHAMELDAQNGNHYWRDAEQRELKQIDDYDTFHDHGHRDKIQPPLGYKKIAVHMVYAVKFDGRHKARLVAGGHLTDTPVDSVYSSVVSLRGLRLTILMGELTGQAIWNTDIGNAYLEAFTAEKIYIIAGEEFGDREGHFLIINKALYGLKSSGLRWWERFSEVLLQMGFFPSKAEDDIWMRRIKDHYEYIARYVDDLVIVSKSPELIINDLEQTHKFKLKGTGPIDYHLGADFFRDDDGTLCMAPKKYIDRLVASYTRMFGEKPKHNVSSPLEKNDHPELDTSPELDIGGIKKYQSLIGSLQWAVSLGRFDIATAVMTMSRFRSAPRQGHLERVKRMCGYVSKMCHATIRFRPGVPDYSELPTPSYDWDKSVYGEIREEVPCDVPEPLGPKVVHTAYVDANLLHDLVTGRSVTGVLHFVNKTPSDWYTRRQGTVETATFGSEIVAARTMVEQTIDLRLTLRYMGANLQGPSFAFGDNKTVVDSVNSPKCRLNKRHVILSFHRVRESIAAKVVRFYHLPGAANPSDVLSKAWGYQQVWGLIQAILFWKGDTLALID